MFINKKNGKLDQNWILRSTGLLDWVTIENVETGRYLDSDSIGNVFTSTTSNGDFSKWRFSDQNVINVGTVNVLDTIGQHIIISRPANGVIGQNWVRFFKFKQNLVWKLLVFLTDSYSSIYDPTNNNNISINIRSKDY